METIVLEVPVQFKSVVVCLQPLFAFAESVCAHGASDAPMPFAEVERVLAVGAGELHRGLYEPLLASMARDAPRLWIGAVPHQRAGFSVATYYTLTGPVSVPRWRYRPEGVPSGATVDPIAVRIGAVRGTWFPTTAEAMAFLVQQGPQREAERTAQS